MKTFMNTIPSQYLTNGISFLATAGELNLGRDFFEGDILLTRAQSDYILKSQKNDGLQTRALMKDVKSLWPKGEVPYVINEGLSMYAHCKAT